MNFEEKNLLKVNLLNEFSTIGFIVKVLFTLGTLITSCSHIFLRKSGQACGIVGKPLMRGDFF